MDIWQGSLKPAALRLLVLRPLALAAATAPRRLPLVHLAGGRNEGPRGGTVREGAMERPETGTQGCKLLPSRAEGLEEGLLALACKLGDSNAEAVRCARAGIAAAIATSASATATGIEGKLYVGVQHHGVATAVPLVSGGALECRLLAPVPTDLEQVPEVIIREAVITRHPSAAVAGVGRLRTAENVSAHEGRHFAFGEAQAAHKYILHVKVASLRIRKA
mmetsp:Transcript_39538/g.88871  ORF Transcript_39538/g.88871 Transcript_39538/m.88871 type:complete len:220 (+) Transcript_39538:80-739(+)